MDGRSLARQKPSMTLEEGLRWAMREWQHTSNYDRMIYYEMAGKFLEFEAEEEMQIQKSQWMNGPQCLPSPALPRLEPQGPSAPEAVKEPGTAFSTGATAKARGAKGGHCPHTPCLPSREGFVPSNETAQESRRAGMPVVMKWVFTWSRFLATLSPRHSKMMLSHKCPSYGASSRGPVVQVVLTQLGPTSVYPPSKASTKAPPACLPPPRPQQPAETKAHLPPPRTQQPAETKAPEEITTQVVQEYSDIMEELMGPPVGATGELQGQWEEEGKVEQEGDGMLLDPGVLSYVDNLCSQKDFVTKVEAVIHPRFLEELLSPDPQMDFLALSKELEQEEGLTLAQVAEKRLQSSKKERCERAAPSHGTTQLDSISSKSAEGQEAERDVSGPQQGVSIETCPPQTAARDPQGQGRVFIGVAKNPVVLSERLDSARLTAARPDSPPQDQRPTCPGVETQDTWGLPGASPVKESHRLCKGSSEEEREIPDIITAVGTNYRLQPWKLSQGPVPALDPLSPEGRKLQGPLQSQSANRRGLSPAPTPATKSKKRALVRGPSPAVQTPRGSSEEEREIPDIITVVGTNYRLRPWKMSQSPVLASDLLSPEGRKPQGPLQSQSANRRGLSPTPTPATKFKKRALVRSPSPAAQTPKGSSEEEREIPDVITVVGTNYRLRPWKLSQSPAFSVQKGGDPRDLFSPSLQREEASVQHLLPPPSPRSELSAEAHPLLLRRPTSGLGSEAVLLSGGGSVKECRGTQRCQALGSHGGQPHSFLQMLQELTDAEETLIPPTAHSQGPDCFSYQHPWKILGC
ncbi:hypothetical protein P7K49_005165 [Saguinus oedipus]|uniref:Nuclear Testis protein N-terminal domain-containing protein n=1 Tax=Saguinus oedipus TaxID=9490 RepID=A0ABQ9W9H7_SAGOE|nr:hypothetical protein P7K49_005165 [Saguinus oedipus]